MSDLVYFICEDCSKAVGRDDLEGSYMHKKCSSCKHQYFFNLVEKKIENADKQTLDILIMFFSDETNVKKFGWKEKEAEYFLNLIKLRDKNILRLSTILMQGR